MPGCGATSETSAYLAADRTAEGPARLLGSEIFSRWPRMKDKTAPGMWNAFLAV
jgi:hypothetical protein